MVVYYQIINWTEFIAKSIFPYTTCPYYYLFIHLTSFIFPTDDPRSKVFGSVTDGVFEGKIIAHDGSYYVEHARRYFPPNSTRTRVHSIIYKDSDVTDPYANRRHGK